MLVTQTPPAAAAGSELVCHRQIAVSECPYGLAFLAGADDRAAIGGRAGLTGGFCGRPDGFAKGCAK